MKILVTGGCGYIGSHTTYALLDKGHDVIVLDDLSTGFQALLPPGADFVKGDIADRAILKPLLRDNGIEAIVHFAGSIIVPESVKNPLKYYQNNTAKTMTLIDEAVQADVKKFLFSSTSVVYDHQGAEPLSETGPLNPVSPYGRSKLMTEMMLEDVAKAHNLLYGVLRYFNAAGADPAARTGQSSRNATHLIKVACQVALGQKPLLEIYGTDYPTRDGTCIRDYIHVSDLAAAHIDALEYLEKSRKSFVMNCGYGHGSTVREVVEVVKKLSGVDFIVRDIGRRPGDPPCLIADNTMIRKELNWKPRYDNLEIIVKTALEWEGKLQSLSLDNAA